jgi:FkbM family methyltransferase
MKCSSGRYKSKMDLSRIPKNSFLGRLLRLPLGFLPGKTIVPILQGELRGYRWIVGSGVHGYWLGSYEWDKQQFFCEVVREGQVVFDIGANVGFYTLLASCLVGPRGKVFAFEPLPENVRYLERHLELNECGNAEVLSLAMSDRCGFASFSLSGNRFVGCLDEQGELKVRVSSVDALVLEARLPFPDVMKIDVEGEELRVLRGASRTIERCQPLVLLATHNDHVHSLCVDFTIGSNDPP